MSNLTDAIDIRQRRDENGGMRLILRQKIWLSIVITVNALLWLIPDDVVANVARDQQTMVGRYSRTHFAWNLGVLAISILSFYVDWSTGSTYKRRWFQVLATLFFLFPCVVLVDYVLRTGDTMHYIRDEVIYHRPPNSEFRLTFVDRPQAYRTYPNIKPGFGTVECAGRTDARGYRNPTTLNQCDVVTLGDSFTEGSSVSDEHPWPVRLAELTHSTVCNLGMSGYDPFHYLESLRRIGLDRKPRLVICMLYEGNDFRSSASDEKRRNPSASKRLVEYVDRSPLIKLMDRAITSTFAPIGASRPLPDGEILDWLPLSVPQSGPARPYAFEPKQLRDLLISYEQFENDKHWHNPRDQISQMNDLCKSAGAEFVLVMAPTKARVLLPLVAQRLDADKVRQFTSIDYKKPLPPTESFLSELLTLADSKERVISDWCANQGIPFFSPAEQLRTATAEGTQCYYSYDQHWTPLGHEVFAKALGEFLLAQSLVPPTLR